MSIYSTWIWVEADSFLLTFVKSVIFSGDPRSGDAVHQRILNSKLVLENEVPHLCEVQEYVIKPMSLGCLLLLLNLMFQTHPRTIDRLWAIRLWILSTPIISPRPMKILGQLEVNQATPTLLLFMEQRPKQKITSRFARASLSTRICTPHCPCLLSTAYQRMWAQSSWMIRVSGQFRNLSFRGL